MKPSLKLFGCIIIIIGLLMGSTIGVVGEKEELPDLVIDDIVIEFLPFQHVYADIYNIGDADTDTGFNISIRIRRTALGIIPGLLWIDRTVYFPDTIPAGEYDLALLLEDINELPRHVFPRIYRFTCIVNPDHAITESNYLNNIHHEYFIIILGGLIWFPYN